MQLAIITAKLIVVGIESFLPNIFNMTINGKCTKYKENEIFSKKSRTLLMKNSFLFCIPMLNSIPTPPYTIRKNATPN